MKFKVVKSLTGKLSVKYECPHCNEVLENALSDAGENDVCPVCAKSFVVPGLQERKQYEAKRAELELEKRKKREDALLEQQAKAEAKANALRLAEETRQKQAEIAEQQERMRAEASAKWQAENRHPFIYRVVQFVPQDPIAAQFADIVNKNAENGWEFFKFEVIQTYQAPGCIAGILGVQGSVTNNHLAIFRRHV